MVESLDGRSFILEHAEGITLATPPDAVRLSFSQDELGLAPGCNAAGGHYTLSGARLRPLDMTQTEMGCEPALHVQDERLMALLRSEPELLLDGDHLIVRGDAVTLHLLDSEVARPDVPRTRPEGFVVDAYVQGDMAGFSGRSALTRLTFGEDGVLRIESPCGPGRALYSPMYGEHLRIEELEFAAAECTEDVDRKLGEHLRVVLAPGEILVTIDEQQLRLMRVPQGITGHAAAPRETELPPEASVAQ